MAFLERFRAQPRWKHADPQVRAAAVFELDVADQDTLSWLLKEDPDAHVRRAALGRVLDEAAIIAAAQHDADEAIREEASRRLTDIAVRTDDPARGAAALAGVTNERRLGQIARSA